MIPDPRFPHVLADDVEAWVVVERAGGKKERVLVLFRAGDVCADRRVVEVP